MFPKSCFQSTHDRGEAPPSLPRAPTHRLALPARSRAVAPGTARRAPRRGAAAPPAAIPAAGGALPRGGVAWLGGMSQPRGGRRGVLAPPLPSRRAPPPRSACARRLASGRAPRRRRRRVLSGRAGHGRAAAAAAAGRWAVRRMRARPLAPPLPAGRGVPAGGGGRRRWWLRRRRKMPGKLKVKIVAGRHLPVMDRASDLTDAFVEVGGDRGRGAPPLRHLPGPAATGPPGGWGGGSRGGPVPWCGAAARCCQRALRGPEPCRRHCQRPETAPEGECVWKGNGCRINACGCYR